MQYNIVFGSSATFILSYIDILTKCFLRIYRIIICVRIIGFPKGLFRSDFLTEFFMYF